MKGIAILSLVAVLAGCAGTGVKPEMEDARTAELGKGYALVGYCLDTLWVPQDTGEAFLASVKQVLATYSFKRDVFMQSNRAAAQELLEQRPSELREECTGARELLPAATRSLQEYHRKGVAYRKARRSTTVADALIMFTQAFGDFNEDMSTYNANTAPAYREQPQPDFGQPESDSEHILINTEDGQVLCTAVNGSYAHCY